MHGYTLLLADTIKRAPRNKLGVRLGRACLAANVSVIEAADHFGVSRPTIYSWFTGRCNPRYSQEDAIEQYIKKLA
jgi:transcriptional regulator with XRE-family HTH domain